MGTFSRTGRRNITVELPKLGESSSTDGAGTVTAAMVKAGLEFVVRLDPPAKDGPAGGALAEVNESNNEHTATVSWKLPDLVATLPGRPKSFQFGGDPVQLAYKVNNAGGGTVPEGSTWTEQVWIGTDEKVWLADDVANGVWHQPGRENG